MAPARIAPSPRDLFIALLSAASAGHTAFLVILTWRRPELGFGGVISLFLLPFLFILLGFVPVVLLLAILRILMLRVAPALMSRSLVLTAVLAIIGIAISCALAWLATGWIADAEIASAILFGAAIGGVFGALKLGAIDEPSATQS